MLCVVPCFNRYMVECKYRSNNCFQDDRIVLIDTWWNVNSLAIAVTDHDNIVLIDTWWNVNKNVSVNMIRSRKF